MLKLQKPHDFSLYTAVDPVRISELHLAGFIPEYLYGSYAYFRTTDKLVKYLETGEIEKPIVAKPKTETTVKMEAKVEKGEMTEKVKTPYRYKKDKE